MAALNLVPYRCTFQSYTLLPVIVVETDSQHTGGASRYGPKVLPTISHDAVDPINKFWLHFCQSAHDIQFMVYVLVQICEGAVRYQSARGVILVELHLGY